MQIGMKTTLQTLPWVVASALALAIGLYALRFIQADASLLPPGLRANFQAHPIAFTAHTTAGALALLAAPWQLLGGWRGRRPRVHRWTGRLYVAACLIGGVAGLRIAFGTAYGPVAVAGFAGLALAWLAATTLGFIAAREGDYQRHRAWMLRSVALTFAAVTIRLQLAGIVAFRFDFAAGYAAASWLCWLPNLAVAEWWIRKRAAPRTAVPGGRRETTPPPAV